MRRARQELDDTLVSLTGETGEDLRRELMGEGLAPGDWLAVDKRARLSALRSAHASEIEEVVARGFPGAMGPSLSDELRSELRSLRQRQREELRVLLGPGDYTEYEARESPEAGFVRLHLPEARDEAEFRLMVQAAIEAGVEPNDASVESVYRHVPAEAFPDRRPNPREQALARFRDLSSPERAAEFERERAADLEVQAREAGSGRGQSR